MTLKLRLVIIIAVQTIFLLLMIGLKQYTLITGIPIVLETRPVDPRSLFRGDYVRLNYNINQLKIKELEGDRDFKPNDRIYVLLRERGASWVPISIYHKRPIVPANHVAIKGKVQGASSYSIRIRYGIENYFVPEGKGREIERPSRGDKITISVAVDKFGKAGIKGVLLNGQPLYSETLL